MISHITLSWCLSSLKVNSYGLKAVSSDILHPLPTINSYSLNILIFPEFAKIDDVEF